MKINDRTAVVGVGQTAFARRLESSEKKLACEAIFAALDDAGIEPGEVDALCSYTIEGTDELDVAKTVGMGDIRFFSQIGYGGGGVCATIGHLALAIATGRADVGVAWRSRKYGSQPRPWIGAEQLPTPSQWTRPWGLNRSPDEIAMLARRYMYETGLTRDHLANVAISTRRHANRNPNAVMYERELTRETYMSSRWIAEPFCLYDCCLETDGAVALVVTSAERAKDTKRKPVYINSFAQALTRQSHTMVNYWSEEPLVGPSWACAAELWRQADFRPEEVDVAQIYDAFSFLVPVSLEAYGFCPPGEAGDFTDDGQIELGGRLPVNTSGGCLSEAYIHGFNLLAEGVRQLRGEGPNPVPGAETCLVTAGECAPTSAVLLRA